MYPQGVCRIRKPACAGNGCAIFPIFQTADWGQKICRSATDDLFRVSLGMTSVEAVGGLGNALVDNGQNGIGGIF